MTIRATLAIGLFLQGGVGLFAQSPERVLGQRQNQPVRVPSGQPAMPLLSAIDRNGDGKLSKAEVGSAAIALKKLDQNGDGKLSTNESGWPPNSTDGIPLPAPPVIAAIDADDDGVVSAAEIANATAALRRLDRNEDDEVVVTEMFPQRRDRGGFGGPGGPGGGFGGRGGPGGGRGGFGGQPSGPKKAPSEIEFKDGVAQIPDHETYHKLSYRGPEVMIDTFLANLEFVKFTLDGAGTDDQQLYFINTKTHRAHMMFARVAGLSFGRGGDQMKGVLVYRPMLQAPNGTPGLYTFEFEPFDSYSFEQVAVAHRALISKMPLLKGKLGYYPRDRGLTSYERDKTKYKSAGLPAYLEEDLNNTKLGYLPLNTGHCFGMLRLMTLEERPGPRDVVIYHSLPNELSRVAGVITEARQTPLSHVNLRAVQDGIPNAFITNVSEDATVKSLIGKWVEYKVTPDGYQIREADDKDVQAYFRDRRPKQAQVPDRNLSVKKIRTLDDVSFADATSVGVKAANLAAMRDFRKIPDGVIPAGHAIPFYFYDEFMKHNDFYNYVDELLANPEFKGSREAQIAELKKLRALIKKGKMPPWMLDQLQTLHQSYPNGTSLRCRSSTNNEDLPGFSGAGLYDSYTHKVDEGHLSKSIRQVFASIWNFRAFEEREFYRVDHSAAAMGVLVHPNFKDELSNGVAVTDDILYQTQNNYYVNTQVGEDLVTNPDEESVPEELLLAWYAEDGQQIMQSSNLASDGQPLLSADHLGELRTCLGEIHGRFARLYGRSPDDEKFAMEIEFKITGEGKLVIKQARPWVFGK